MHSTKKKNSWRDYQADLQKKTFLQTLFGFLPSFKTILLLFLTAATCTGIYFGAVFVFKTFNERDKGSDSSPVQEIKKTIMTRADVQTLLRNAPVINSNKQGMQLTSEGQQYYINTNLDVNLQNFALKQFKRIRKLKRGKPKEIGMVALNPDTGRVLMMAGFDIEDASRNTCISTKFPAASLFKIVTASAAVEALNYNANSRIYYNGGKYTLYKSQLKDKKNKYTNRTTLKDSFAQSINPVFGKLGAKVVGGDRLFNFAESFGFNQQIDFDIPMDKSQVSITEEPYQWAEIACGFNRDTQISPLHGALIASTIANSGKMVDPSIVSTIEDINSAPIYKSEISTGTQVIKAGTAREIKKMMQTTISSGTGRKSFRGYRKDKVLSKLILGGKTGSISGKSRDVKYDWFVGFAEEKKGTGKLAVAIVVGHRKYIGTRSSQFAKMIIREYFDNVFSAAQTASVKK